MGFSLDLSFVRVGDDERRRFVDEVWELFLPLIYLLPVFGPVVLTDERGSAE